MRINLEPYSLGSLPASPRERASLQSSEGWGAMPSHPPPHRWVQHSMEVTGWGVGSERDKSGQPAPMPLKALVPSPSVLSSTPILALPAAGTRPSLSPVPPPRQRRVWHPEQGTCPDPVRLHADPTALTCHGDGVPPANCLGCVVVTALPQKH